MNNKIESEQKGGSRAGFKALRIFRTVFIYVLAAGIIISALMFAASVNPSKSLFGYRYYTVLTPSMEPAYSVGDMVFVKIENADNINVGDVITFNPSSDGEAYLTHRVVEKLPDYQGTGVTCFKTKGDANDSEDTFLIDEERVVGVVTFKIPVMGYVVRFVQMRWYFIVPIIALIFVFFKLSLSADISEFQSAVVKINSYTKEFDLTDPKECTVETIDGNQYYKVSYKQYFTEMTSGFDIDLVCNNTICNTVEGFSVKSYADGIIRGDEDDYLKNTAGLSDEKIEKLKELCKSMLNLGAMAQLQFGVNTWDLANENIDYSAPAIDPETLVEPVYTVEGAKCHATAMYLTDNSVRFINKEKWDKVYLWYSDEDWNDTSVEMEKTGEKMDDCDVYSAVIPGDYESSIWFTDATDFSTYYNKTDSQYFSDSSYYSYYYYPGDGYDYEEYYYWYLDYESPSSDREIRFINTLNWDNVYVWTVNGETAFPGVQMTYLETNKDGDKVYTTEVPNSDAELVFSDGTEENAASSVKLVTYYQYPDDENASKSLGGNMIPAWKAVPGDVFSDYGITYEGSNVGLFNQTAYGIMLRSDSAEGLKVYRNGEEVAATQIMFNLDGSYSMYRLFDIPAAEITDGVELKIHVDKVTDAVSKNATTPDDDLTVKFSPVSYIKRALTLGGSKYENLRNTVTALYDFGQKAKAYFATV